MVQNRDKISGRFTKSHSKALTKPCYVRLDSQVSINIRVLAKRLKKSLSETIQLACEKYISEIKPEDIPVDSGKKIADFKFR